VPYKIEFLNMDGHAMTWLRRDDEFARAVKQRDAELARALKEIQGKR
jgi:hypothetical protein